MTPRYDWEGIVWLGEWTPAEREAFAERVAEIVEEEAARAARGPA